MLSTNYSLSIQITTFFIYLCYLCVQFDPMMLKSKFPSLNFLSLFSGWKDCRYLQLEVRKSLSHFPHALLSVSSGPNAMLVVTASPQLGYADPT